MLSAVEPCLAPLVKGNKRQKHWSEDMDAAQNLFNRQLRGEFLDSRRAQHGRRSFCFGDGSARPIQAKDLWILRWNRKSSRKDLDDTLS